MKILCSKTDLLNGVQIVSKAVPNRTTMTILECILINAGHGSITLTANDMELGIETTIDGDVAESGTVALDAKILLDIVRKLPDSNVTIQTDEYYKTTITCGKARFTILGKSGDDFTTLPSLERQDCIVISQFSLKEAVRQTIFSIADNDNNRMMSGELFDIHENSIRIVSLDGHRISIRRIDLKEQCEPRKVIIPGKTLNEVSKIINGDADNPVSIYFAPRHVIFEFDRTVVVSRVIEGEYFKIDQMLSGDYETKVSVNKRELLECIERATLLVKEGDKKPVIMTFREDSMELRINSALGSMDEQIDITKIGKDLMIGFNPRFLIDALRAIDDEKVDLYMVNPKSPCFIKNVEESYIYLILPVNFINVG